MRPSKLLVLLGILGFAAQGALAQGPPDEERERRSQQRPPGEGGFWPTPVMLDRFIDRITEDMGREYNFDEDQLYNTRQVFKERLPKWLNENRAEIMQLTNQYVETLLNGEPPDADFVADWAQRVLPLFDEFTDLAEGVGDEMRPFLTEDQQAILEGQMAAFRVGVKYVNQRLSVWSEGGFDPETEWPRNRQARDAQRTREKQMQDEMAAAERAARGEAPAEASAAPSPQPGPEAKPGRAGKSADRAGPKDAWARYVDDFIRRYQLNDEQKASAQKFLKSAQGQRDAYVRRNGEKITEAERKLKDTKSDEERQAAEEETKKLTRPLDRMFTQLKEKLDTLPTRAQRQAAAKTEADRVAEPKTTKTEGGATQPGAKRESPSSP